ncbi:MAG: nitrous oxide reductase family maturation protein NosD [Rhodobacterales bacterium]
MLSWHPANGAERLISPGPGALLEAVKTAKAGDILRLGPGNYFGPLNIDRPLTLDGAGKATIRGNGKGSVITVLASDVTVHGLTITGSGSSNETLDSAVKLPKGWRGAKILNNIMTGNLLGVDVHGARDALVANNIITGRQDKRMNARGNGVYVWNAPGLIMENNDIRYGRDGVFVNTSNHNIFRNNRFRDLRFAVHYMYTHNSVVSGNISQRNHLGYAVMFSDNVQITDNVSLDDRTYGIMLNYTNDSNISGNLVKGTRDRCIFVYNAQKNTIFGNRLEHCGIGIHFTAGSERNVVTGNAFIGNRTQVKYVGSKWVDWSKDGRGNYWSNFSAYDLDGDGVAEGVFRPNDAVDRILWTQPAARLLLGSPAVQLVRWSQSAFPALLPGGVVDRHPLMQPVNITIPDWKAKHGQ